MFSKTICCVPNVIVGSSALYILANLACIDLKSYFLGNGRMPIFPMKTTGRWSLNAIPADLYSATSALMSGLIYL